MRALFWLLLRSHGDGRIQSVRFVSQTEKKRSFYPRSGVGCADDWTAVYKCGERETNKDKQLHTGDKDSRRPICDLLSDITRPDRSFSSPCGLTIPTSHHEREEKRVFSLTRVNSIARHENS